MLVISLGTIRVMSRSNKQNKKRSKLSISNTKTSKQTSKQTNKQTNKQTKKQTVKEANTIWPQEDLPHLLYFLAEPLRNRFFLKRGSFYGYISYMRVILFAGL